MGHFAKFIRPGARRVVCGSSRDVLEVTAFRNLDGSIAIIVMNQSEVEVDFWLKISGFGAAEAEALPRSIMTFLFGVCEDSEDTPEKTGILNGQDDEVTLTVQNTCF